MTKLTRTILLIAAGTAAVVLADIPGADAAQVPQATQAKPTNAKVELKATRLAALSFRMRVLNHQRANRAKRRAVRRLAASLN